MNRTLWLYLAGKGFCKCTIGTERIKADNEGVWLPWNSEEVKGLYGTGREDGKYSVYSVDIPYYECAADGTFKYSLLASTASALCHFCTNHAVEIMESAQMSVKEIHMLQSTTCVAVAKFLKILGIETQCVEVAGSYEDGLAWKKVLCSAPIAEGGTYAFAVVPLYNVTRGRPNRKSQYIKFVTDSGEYTELPHLDFKNTERTDCFGGM